MAYRRGSHDRTRADAGRFGTMYDEGACMATPALELIERANRDAAAARAARATRSGSSLRTRLAWLRERFAATFGR